MEMLDGVAGAAAFVEPEGDPLFQILDTVAADTELYQVQGHCALLRRKLETKKAWMRWVHIFAPGRWGAGKQEDPMSVAKNTEITASGSTIEAAIGHGVDRATATLKNIKQVWVKEIVAKVDGGKISEYRVDMKITFVLDDA
jgi:flavin-binding protein dodecin